MAEIIDAHHHIWRQDDLPWLAGPMLPRIFGPYDAIRRNYPATEFLADLEGSGVVKSVYVQANWAADRFEDETAWVQKTAEEAGWPHAIVGFADFMSDDVRPQLDLLCEYPLLRGIRQQIHWHENEAYQFAPHADVAADDTFRRNIACLGDYGLSFDLQVFARQMQGAAELAAEEAKRSAAIAAAEQELAAQDAAAAAAAGDGDAQQAPESEEPAAAPEDEVSGADDGSDQDAAAAAPESGNDEGTAAV